MVTSGDVNTQKVKIQHYVPRFYLKNFSKTAGKEFFLNCFDKSNFKQFSVNIKKIACENYFYEMDKVTSQQLEKALSAFEAKFNDVYEKLVTKKHLVYLNWKEKVTLAIFVTTQEIRTREMREMLRDTTKKLNDWLSNKPLSKDLERQLREIGTEKKIRAAHSSFIIETLLGKNELVSMLLGLKWRLYENNTKMPFWTSDHPINRFNPLDLSPYGNLGLLSRGIEIFFPLTPHLGIAFCDPVEYFFNPEKSVCIEDNVLFYNTLQLRSSARHIFSGDDDFSIARKWLNENPDFKNLYRDRVSTNLT